MAERGIAPWQPPWAWPERPLRIRPRCPPPRRGLLAFFLSGLAWLGRALRYRRAPRSVPEMTYWRVVGWPGCS